MAIATTSPTNKTVMENVVIASTRGAESAEGAAGGERVLGELGGLIGVVVDRLLENIVHGTPHSRGGQLSTRVLAAPARPCVPSRCPAPGQRRPLVRSPRRCLSPLRGVTKVIFIVLH